MSVTTAHEERGWFESPIHFRCGSLLFFLLLRLLIVVLVLVLALRRCDDAGG
jgi:hypothetical protein